MIINTKAFSAKNFGVIHFSGIGGIGMSGIAEILHNLGCKIQGSDLNDNVNITRLKKLGISISIGHKESNIKGSSVVVRSSAVKDSNPEIIAARKNKIPVIARADMLKEIMYLKKSITVAGSHGKTTTTSIIAHLFEAAKLNPTVINGGILNSCNTNAYLGSGEWLVAEADESDGSFNKLPADIAVVTNVDPEHMEFYGSFANLRQSFKRFIEKVPFYGFAVLCYDNQTLLNLASEINDRKIISYGFAEKTDIRCKNIEVTDFGVKFDVAINIPYKTKLLKNLYLPIYGKHNISNALAAIAIAIKMDFNEDIIRNSLKNFLGVKRRLTITGTVNDITVIDDYAHHPTEIEASLNAVSEIRKIKNKGNIIAIMQPHRYSRLLELFNNFAYSFKRADKIFITDVYAAGEQEIAGINKKSLVKAIKDTGQKNVYMVDNLNNLDLEIKKHLQENDIIIFLGAGDITKYANEFPKKLANTNQ